MEQVQKYIPNKLRKYRKQAGYKQKDVAFLLGIKSAGRISEWENGTSRPSIENLLKLALIYRTLCDQLYCNQRKEFSIELAKREQELLKNTQHIRDVGG